MRYVLPEMKTDGHLNINERTDRPHLFGFYFAQEFGLLAGGSGIDRWSTPSELETSLRGLGMNYCTFHIANKYGCNLTNVPPDWNVVGDIQPHVEHFEANDMYYGLFSWRTWSSLNRDMSILYTHARDHFVELALAASEIIGTNCTGYTTDWEYDGWWSVTGYSDPNGVPYSEAFPDGSSEHDLWLTDRVEGGFMQALWNTHPELVYGGAPNGAYWSPYGEDQPYDYNRQIWYNHQNKKYGGIWSTIASMGHRAWSHIEDGAFQIGLSAGQFGDLAWHVGVDHVWYPPNAPSMSGGLRDHLLYALLDDPRLITITMTGGNYSDRGYGNCPACENLLNEGYDVDPTADVIDGYKKQVMNDFGSKLGTIPWHLPLAKWGDLKGEPTKGTQNDVITPELAGVAYMLDSEPRLWIVNFNEGLVNVSVEWSRGETQDISIGPYDFETTTKSY